MTAEYLSVLATEYLSVLTAEYLSVLTIFKCSDSWIFKCFLLFVLCQYKTLLIAQLNKPIKMDDMIHWCIQAIWRVSITVWVPKLLCFFSSILCSVVFQQKIWESNDQWFHMASNYFEMAWRTKMQTTEKQWDNKG